MSPVKIGHFGGSGGSRRALRQTPDQLIRVVIYGDGQAITALQFTYADSGGNHHDVGPWGSDPEEDPSTQTWDIELGNSSYLKEVSGTHGRVNNMDVITSLTFVTNNNKPHTYGKPYGTTFRVPVEDGKIVGFFGRSGKYLDAIGAYCA